MTIQVITEKQAAENLSLSVRTLQRMREAGNGPVYIRMGDRRVGYKLDDIEKWVDSRTYSHMAAELVAKSQAASSAPVLHQH